MKNTNIFLIIATAVTLLTMILFHSNMWSALIILATSYYLIRYLIQTLTKNFNTVNKLIAVVAALALFVITYYFNALTICGIITLIIGAIDIYIAYSKK